MDLKLKPISAKYLLPVASFSSLFAAILIAGLNLSFPAKAHTVLLAASNIAAGEVITENKLEQVRLPLGAVAKRYLTTFRSGFVAKSSIYEGELLAKSMISVSEDQRVPIRINNLPQISKKIKIGDRVDVWASSVNTSEPVIPQPVVFGAIVLAIETNNSMAQATTSVELRIEPEYLESLLGATDSNQRISLILQETLNNVQ